MVPRCTAAVYTEIAGAQQFYDRDNSFVCDVPKRQEANCIIRLMYVDVVLYSRTHRNTVLTSAEFYETIPLDRGSRASGMDGHMFFWMLFAIRQSVLFDSLFHVRGKRQHVCRYRLNESCKQ